MQLPIFIEINENLSVNANHVMFVMNGGPESCVLNLSTPGKTNVNGSWSAGGAGNMSSYTDTQTIIAPYSKKEWETRVNSALALVNMMQQRMTAT